MVEVGGLRVRVRVQGAGDLLLLLNGFRRPLESWDHFVASVDGRTIIRLDVPGVGESTTPVIPPTMASLASVVNAVLDDLGFDHVDVVGYSHGGAVAQQFAHDFPARVGRLVLVATSCGVGSTLGWWDWLDVVTSSNDVANWTGAVASWWHALAITPWSSIPFLGGLTQPTLVVCGSEDTIAPPANSRVLASRIPDATLVTLGIDHDVQRPSSAKELATVVQRFLAGRRTFETAAIDPQSTRTRRTNKVFREADATMTPLNFDGRVAIITGAGGGLGRSHALELARRGALVVVNDLGGAVDGSGASASAAQLVVDEITAFGGIALANHDSVATPEGGESIVQAAIDAFGRVDVLINNAGILRDKAFHKMDADMIDRVIDVHLKGAFYVTEPAFRRMREQGYGRIVTTSSASGLFGNFGQANYGAAKAGLAGLTRVLAIEGAVHGIKANAIAPIALTRMTEGILGDLSSKVSPESVSPLVAYLANEACSVSGHIYSVAGGRIARIFVGETNGVVLDQNTAEAILTHLDEIDEIDPTGFYEPASLDGETTIIAKELAKS